MRRNQTLPSERRSGRIGRCAAWAALWTGSLLALIVLVNLVLMPMVTRRGVEQRCPSVLGQSFAEAENLLRRAGFEPVLEGRRADPADLYEAGEVMDQYPRPGRMTKGGRRVHLTVSTGGRAMRVPDLKGATLRQAQSLLSDARLALDTLRQRWRFDDRYGEGTVLSQLPASGDSLTPGAEVAVVISLGPYPEWVIAPGLLGLSLGEADRLLERSGLTMGFVDAAADSLLGRVVQAQEPAPGTPLVPGSAIDLQFRERMDP